MRQKDIIEKCHFCTERAGEGIEPACVTACPTGALRMTELADFPSQGVEWFPETGIKPSLRLTGTGMRSGPLIVPAEDAGPDEGESRSLKVTTKIIKEWSLLVFSLLVTASMALFVAYALNGDVPAVKLPALMLTAALIMSFAHLGVRTRGWRAILNVTSSPLSREILMVIIITAMAYLNWFRPGTIHPLIQAGVALLTLISADLVFFAADRSPGLKLHSGQMFFSGIFMASWFIVPSTVFLLFSMLAAISVIMRYRSLEKGQLIRSLYYFRALSIPAVFMLLYTGSKITTAIAAGLLLAGIVADRALFLDDFNPVNIKETISDNFNAEYEKERDKQRQNTGLS